MYLNYIYIYIYIYFIKISICILFYVIHVLPGNTWEILTGGELLMNRQRRSTFEPRYPDFPSSISTVWPIIPVGETQGLKKTFTYAGHTHTHRHTLAAADRPASSCSQSAQHVELIKWAELSEVIHLSGVRGEPGSKVWIRVR